MGSESMSTLEIVLLAMWPTVVVVGVGIAVWQSRHDRRPEDKEQQGGSSSEPHGGAGRECGPCGEH